MSRSNVTTLMPLFIASWQMGTMEVVSPEARQMPSTPWEMRFSTTEIRPAVSTSDVPVQITL